MFMKIHRSVEAGIVVAVCDRDLVNTTITDGDMEVKISESFYGSRSATEEEIVDALTDAGNANIIGERSVALAVKHGIVAEESCIRIGRVPHALVFRL
ncbi:MAG TPA: DUF424 domain-containing protein [Methanoregulaceae archaeon]|nr:DUF424 domain-containing protein [Methanoregulaceae archaeon]HPD75347.1 DUF424 domain-containing protein [Methanoregulaceae archaeon]HRY75903.1 DUF424 domain-containing protein [Methanoregulaceae archaeon]